MEHALEFGRVNQASRPNIFEVIAQEQTKSLLEPLLRYALDVYAIK